MCAARSAWCWAAETRNPTIACWSDLGAESIDVLNIIVTLEQKYGVSIDESAMAGVSTVRDLYQLVLKSAHAAIPPADTDRPA